MTFTLGDYGFDLIDLLVGFDNAETQLQALVDVIDAILNDDVNQHPGYLKDLALKLVLTASSAADPSLETNIDPTIEDREERNPPSGSACLAWIGCQRTCMYTG